MQKNDYAKCQCQLVVVVLKIIIFCIVKKRFIWCCKDNTIPYIYILQDRDKLDIRPTKEYYGEDIFLFIAAIDCSLLEFNVLIASPCTSGWQAGHYIHGRSNTVVQSKKYFPA